MSVSESSLMMTYHKQGRQHSGLMDAYGEPYPELKTVLRACADEMYAIATGAV